MDKGNEKIKIPEEKNLDILLAEDDIISQKLTLLLIKRKGWNIDAVNSGDKAYQAYLSGKYDVVLMDVQMPVMNGIEVTKKIREREAAFGVHTPIIALTAHAMKGDKERCLESGMDSYISKPLAEEELYSTILKVWAKFAQPIEINSDSPANLSGLIKLLGGSKDDLLEIVKEFLSYYPSILTEINLSLNPVDFDRLEKSSHKLKGSLSNFDAKKAYQIALQLEMHGKEKNSEDLNALFLNLNREMDNLRVFMENFK